MAAGKVSEIINARGAPWRLKYATEQQRTQALIEYGRETFGETFFDAIPLRSTVGDLDGVAFVLAYEPSLASHIAAIGSTSRTCSSRRRPTTSCRSGPSSSRRSSTPTTCGRPPPASPSTPTKSSTPPAPRSATACVIISSVCRTGIRASWSSLIALHALSIKSLAVQDDDFYSPVHRLAAVRDVDGPDDAGRISPRLWHHPALHSRCRSVPADRPRGFRPGPGA